MSIGKVLGFATAHAASAAAQPALARPASVERPSDRDAPARQPAASRPATQWKRLTVRLALPGLGLTYADDAEQNRYVFDRESALTVRLEVGAQVMAEVDEAGYASHGRPVDATIDA